MPHESVEIIVDSFSADPVAGVQIGQDRVFEFSRYDHNVARLDNPVVRRDEDALLGDHTGYALVSSSLHREFPDIANQHFHLDTVQDEMLEAAKHFVGGCDKEELLSKLQHFGYSTNLIDFTTDFLIALFFACDGHVAHDGRVVLLRRSDYPTFKPKHPDNPRESPGWRPCGRRDRGVAPH